jgi:hypothetical protein
MPNYRDDDNITAGRVSLFGTPDVASSFPDYDYSEVITASVTSTPIVAGNYIENPPMQYSAVDLLRILGDRIQILPSELREQLLNAIASSMPIEEEWVVNAIVYVPNFFS